MATNLPFVPRATPFQSNPQRDLISAVLAGLLMALMALLVLGGSAAWGQTVTVSVGVEGGTFDDRLSPYGAWLVVPGYGRVWQPASEYVGDDFYPYGSGGHWVFTDEGWVFDSEYPFGWAVFHYGRWMLDPDYGWVWLPGNTWAPAWVTWRRGGAYVGWAPMGPRGALVVHRDHWLFVESRELTVMNVRRHALDQRRFRDAVSVTLPVHAALPIGRAVPLGDVRGARREIPPPPPPGPQLRPPRSVRDAPYRAPPPPPQPARLEPDRRLLPPPPEPARQERDRRILPPPPPGRTEPQRNPPPVRVEPDRDRFSPPPGRMEPQRAPPPAQLEPRFSPPPPQRAPPPERNRFAPPAPGRMEPPRGGPPPPPSAAPAQPQPAPTKKRESPGSPLPSRRAPR